MFGGVFIATGVLHLYYNWKPFKKYLAERAKGHIQVKQELVVSVALTGLIIGLSVLDLPPASWVFAWNAQIKRTWVSSPELEPPFGHAEESSLAGIAKRMDLELPPAMAALKAEGDRIAQVRESRHLQTLDEEGDATASSVFSLKSKRPPVHFPGLTKAPSPSFSNARVNIERTPRALSS